MLPNNLRLLLVGYSETDAALLIEDLKKHNIKISYNAITDVQEIRAAFYECDWHVLIYNHVEYAFNFMGSLEVWKQVGRDIPFIIYSDEISDEKAISAIHYGVHDYVYRSHVTRLVLAIERELKDVETRRAKLQAESKIYRLAYYDDLTGFPKRNLFCEKVTGILSKQNDVHKLAAIYFIKIGRLPYINSTYGYHVGDMLIQQLSYRMSVYTNSKCLLTRIESNKFAFFNSDVNNLEDIQKFADRVMRMVSTPIMINNLEFYVTLNIGVSVYPTHGNNISILLSNAENTLSESQDKWLNSCRYFMNKVGEISTRHLVQGEALRKAIIDNQLVLYYQPIINLETGDLTGTEALLRWNHPEFGMLSPNKFYSLACENGLALDIGKWMIKQACIQTKLWHEMGHDGLSVALRLSSIELDQNQFVKYIQDVLSEIEFSPDYLELAINESFLQQPEISMNSIRELGDQGVQFTVDNYGTGGSSIASLKKLPIKILKLDTTLTSNLDPDSENFSVVTAIKALADNLGLSVMAGKVETQEQLKFLYEVHCNYAQGNIISKPVNAENFLKLLEQRKTGTLA